MPGQEGEGKQERSVFSWSLLFAWLEPGQPGGLAASLARGAGLGAVESGGAGFSAERRMRLRINPANEMSGLVCMSLSPGQDDSV